MKDDAWRAPGLDLYAIVKASPTVTGILANSQTPEAVRILVALLSVGATSATSMSNSGVVVSVPLLRLMKYSVSISCPRSLAIL